MMFPFTTGNSSTLPNRGRVSPLRSVPSLLALGALAAAAAWLVVLANGRLLLPLGFVALLAIVAVTLYRLDWGLAFLVGLSLVMDQFDIPGFPTWSLAVAYHKTLNTSEHVSTGGAGVLTPMELHLLLVLAIFLLVLVVRRSMELRQVPVPLAGGLFFAWLAFSVARGRAAGGDLIVALWEVRGFAIFGIMMLLVPQIVRTKEQVRLAMWVVIAAVSVKALEAAVRFGAQGFSFGNWPFIVDTFANHEDPVFIITLFILLLGLLFWGSDDRQRKALLWLFPLLLLGYVAAKRRATYASLAASLIAFVFLLPPEKRRVFFRWTGVLALVFALYVGAFWNSYSRVGSVAQQFRSTFFPAKTEPGSRDYYSDLYRKQETYNLAVTMKRAPVLGVGFGMPYDQPVRMWGSNFPLAKYIPHNEIVWMLVKTGVLGFLIFWFFFNSFVVYAAGVLRNLKDPYLSAVCVVAVVAVVNQLVVSYVDMQLNWARSMTYLGLLFGLVPAIARIDADQRAEAAAS